MATMFNQKHFPSLIRTKLSRATFKNPACIVANTNGAIKKIVYNPKKSLFNNHREAAQALADEVGMCDDGSVLIGTGWLGKNSMYFTFMPVHPSDAARIVGQKRKKTVDNPAR